MPIVVYYSDRFSHRADEKKFVTFASDLSRGNPFGRLYPDACDEGLGITSRKTGQLATFFINNVKVDIEGDVEYWELLATSESVRKFPQLRDYRVIVLND